jgi:hypothetical protein
MNSDRVEVEWKYILKLHPDESQRPRPSANAKPLPEHLKESDASLDITNRTDGVPEMGDPFQDPHSEHKWAEWHTAPEVTRRIPKVDLNRENQLWYYLGKPSTEARPHYTENPAKQRNNAKSNFLETVKPPPPPVPAFAQRSYPASHPIRPAPIAVPPRTPVQYQGYPPARPYSYKPKEQYMTTWKSPVYNPDTRKNPNSPVAHQPNVSYDHRPPSQGHGQPQYQGYHHHRPSPQAQTQQFQYHPYVPPQAQSTTGWKAQPATTGPMLNGIDQYAHTSQSKALPPNPYATQESPRQLPPYPWSQGAGQNTRPTHSPAPYTPFGQAPPGQAPASSTQSNPSGTPKPPMYADAPSSLVIYAAQSPTEYLAYVMKFPYLKNAYLRRAKTYVSPYSPGGGFTQAWMPNISNSGPPTAMAPNQGGPMPSQPHYHGQQPSSDVPAHRPTAQFQSSDAFQRDMARTSQPIDGTPKWEQMLKQLATSTGPSTQHSATAGPPQAPHPYYASPSSRSSMSYDIPKNIPTAHSHTPPQLQPREPQRPTPSPISDDGKELSDAQAKPVLIPLQAAPQVHGGETWRYS